jgi:hypothetical protein
MEYSNRVVTALRCHIAKLENALDDTAHRAGEYKYRIAELEVENESLRRAALNYSEDADLRTLNTELIKAAAIVERERNALKAASEANDKALQPLSDVEIDTAGIGHYFLGLGVPLTTRHVEAARSAKELKL